VRICVVGLTTRKDTPLSELATLLSQEFPIAKKEGTRIAFRLLYTDTYRGRVLIKDVGTVVVASEKEDDASKTLDDARYIIGDFIDVAILTGDQRLPTRSFVPREGGPGGYRGLPRGRGDSYRGQGYSRGRGGPPAAGRNGFDNDDRAPPSGPRRDRDRW
jgi:histone deacetylase complex subunit SAP18